MMIGDSTSAALQVALRGLDARRAAHEANIANVETPGYQARSVDFESQLQRAMERGGVAGSANTGGVSPTDAVHEVSVSRAAGRANGNNVNISREMVGLTETALAQELLIRAMNDKYGLIRTAVDR